MPDVELRRTFKRTKFPVEVIRAANAVADEIRQAAYDAGAPRPGPSLYFNVSTGPDEAWQFEDLEECFAEYRRPEVEKAGIGIGQEPVRLSIFLSPEDYGGTLVVVEAASRGDILRVMAPFEEAAPYHEVLHSAPAVSIFIGHGRSSDWRELYEHLRDQHRLDVQAFETHPRAGFTAKEVLERIAAETSLAILVHTAEDEQADESLRARENVVHETGLFQGRIGFARAIIVREDGCDPFSNVAGVQEIRFSPGAMRSVFGDVLAVVRREFG